MSFADKFASLMARPGQDPVAKDDVPWFMRYAGRTLGSVGGFIAIFLGVWNCVSILVGSVDCLISGMWQIVAGFLLICCEAPCCCLFIDYVQHLSEYADKRPHWNKAVGYVVIAIPAIILCPGMSSIFGSGLIFATGVVYGMMALGKKASAEEMRAAAVETQQSIPSASSKPTNMHSNLVANAQPMSFTGAPVYDSNV